MIHQHPQAIEATADLTADMRRAVPEVAFDRVTRLIYSTDASIYQMMPVGVVFPRNGDEVMAAVEVARKHGVPLLPRGGGSSLNGQAINHAIILDFSRHMDQIVEVDPERRAVRVQPGMTLGLLNQRLQAQGLMFGPDPASAERATIGGIVGNNSTGAHSIVYGMTGDHVLALDTVLSDGSHVTLDSLNGDHWETRAKRPGLEGQLYAAMPDLLERYADHIRTRYPRTFRNVAGYALDKLLDVDNPNLARLLVGSEGTLAITLEATLNLVPVPKHKRLALVHFSDQRASLEAVPPMLESDPSAIELMDRTLIDLTREKAEYRRLLTFIEGQPEVVQIVEYAGESEAQLDAGVDRLRDVLNRLGHRDPIVVLADPRQQANVWYVRKVGLGILTSVKGDAKPIPFIEDAAVPVEYVADYVTRIVDVCHHAGADRVAVYGHASAGCVHVRPMVNLKTADGIRQLRDIAQGSVDLVTEFGGTTSSEHGDGMCHGEFTAQLYGPQMLEAFREVKRLFDPDYRLNPGKIIDTPVIDDETLMRYGTNYAVSLEPRETMFSYESDGGFARAIEACSGVGVCRKVHQGVMCPSFMATRDEVHSTRGRANILRLAMVGMLGPEGMTSEQVYNVLDLCLSCKACKRECTSNVDMTKLKAEFLHGYHQKHGVPVRSRLFANIATLNRLGQPFQPLANLMLAGPGKWLMTALGVHPDRTLPQLAPQTFTGWFRRHHDERRSAEKQVAFFHDTFMQHNDPRIGQAAVQVLEAAGYQITVLEQRACCGRPALSKGLLDEARRLAAHNIALLAPYARQGIPIVGCEPSCIGALVDEYSDLLPGEDARLIAQNTMLIDTFLIREAEAGRFELDFEPTPRTVVFHGHCNQKALFGTADTLAMLGLIPNCTVQEVESSCCGMAGSFGYEQEHYDLSLKLAEMSLAPAVRKAAPETIIAATGTSCREQIRHTTGREALHPIEILAGALREAHPETITDVFD